MSITTRLFITVALILIPTFLLFCFGCTTQNGHEEVHEKYNQAVSEWEQVKSAVEAMCAEADPPVTDLKNDSRIDWQNSATRPEDMTLNMTGGYTSDGERALIAIISAENEILPISYYLGRDQTEWKYWIDSRGLVHLAE